MIKIQPESKKEILCFSPMFNFITESLTARICIQIATEHFVHSWANIVRDRGRTKEIEERGEVSMDRTGKRKKKALQKTGKTRRCFWCKANVMSRLCSKLNYFF